ncbi:MAG: D-2-hydroxyacid dehydrogenase [Acidobacteriaceae bacterium]
MASQPKVLVISKNEALQFAMLANVPHVLSCDATAAAAAAQEITSALLWSGTREMVREVVQNCKSLRWIHTRFAGVDNLLFPELVNSDIVLTNAKGVYSAPLGEFALTAILYFAKDVPRLRRNQAAQAWARFEMERIAGKTVGIVGYGDIGRAVAERAHAMGMRIFAMKRHAPEHPDAMIERYYTQAELHQMLAVCDYVVIAAPLTPETQHLIGEAEFAAMKATAVLVNVGRGPVVDTNALVDALNSRQIKGAGLDVADPEPLPAGHPLYAMENVLLSPHCADVVAGWKEDAMRLFLAQYERFEKNEPLLNEVNKRLGY